MESFFPLTWNTDLVGIEGFGVLSTLREITGHQYQD